MPSSNDRARAALAGFLSGFGNTLVASSEARQREKEAEAAAAEQQRKDRLAFDKEVFGMVSDPESDWTPEDYEAIRQIQDLQEARAELLRRQRDRRGGLLEQAFDRQAAEDEDPTEMMTLGEVMRAAERGGAEYMAPAQAFDMGQVTVEPPPGVSSAVDFEGTPPPDFVDTPLPLGPATMDLTGMTPVSGGAGPMGDRLLAQRWQNLPTDRIALDAAARGVGPFENAPREYRQRAQDALDLEFREKARGDYKLAYNEATGMIVPSDFQMAEDLSESQRTARAYYEPTQVMQDNVAEFEQTLIDDPSVVDDGLWMLANQAMERNVETGTATVPAQLANITLSQSERGRALQEYVAEMTALVQNISFALSGKQASFAEIQQRMVSLVPRAGDSPQTIARKQRTRQELLNTIRGMYTDDPRSPQERAAAGEAVNVDAEIARAGGAVEDAGDTGGEWVLGEDGVWRQQ